ncbi:hypothetical protein QBC35DRAFT_517164 [Podospora australis]|uniref:Uncharacterized protein n=1 Tax=Podospora australis TaxID=1536484 RepID=A0AAN6WNF5_9PEZI|nr:hypothetical protein QBC35DRAFT_517164 [Podospora australis]
MVWRQNEEAPRPASSTSNGVGVSREDGGRWPISRLQQRRMAGISGEIWNSARVIAACNVPGYTTLYKAIDEARTHGGLFGKEGKLPHLERLMTMPGSDFGSTQMQYYFTPDVKVAEYYAGYAKRRAEFASVKEMIWHCRQKKSLPKHLRRYQSALLIIGSAARRPNNVYSRLSSWEDITEDFLLKLGPDGNMAADGRIAIQFVFSYDNGGTDWLRENGARDMKVFDWPQPELEHLISESSFDWV